MNEKQFIRLLGFLNRKQSPYHIVSGYGGIINQESEYVEQYLKADFLEGFITEPLVLPSKIEFYYKDSQLFTMNSVDCDAELRELHGEPGYCITGIYEISMPTLPENCHDNYVKAWEALNSKRVMVAIRGKFAELNADAAILTADSGSTRLNWNMASKFQNKPAKMHWINVSSDNNVLSTKVVTPELVAYYDIVFYNSQEEPFYSQGYIPATKTERVYLDWLPSKEVVEKNFVRNGPIIFWNVEGIDKELIESEELSRRLVVVHQPSTITIHNKEYRIEEGVYLILMNDYFTLSVKDDFYNFIKEQLSSMGVVRFLEFFCPNGEHDVAPIMEKQYILDTVSVVESEQHIPYLNFRNVDFNNSTDVVSTAKAKSNRLLE